MRFFSEMDQEDRPTGPISFPDPEWNLVYTTRLSLLFRRPETKRALLEFRKRFLERSDWNAKWSSRHLLNVEGTLLEEVFADSDRSEEHVLAATARAADALDLVPTEHIVVLSLARLNMGAMELVFPNVTFRTVNEQRLTEIRQRYYDIIATTPYAEEEKEAFRARAIEITELLLNRPCAFVTAHGDKTFVLEKATQYIEPFVDFFQLIAALFEERFKEIRISIGGDLLARHPATLIMAADGTSIRDENKFLFDHRLQLEERHLAKMRTDGFGPLIDALGKDDDDRTEFEKIMLRSMHWIADGERQRSPENRITSYITAIDMFFSSKGGPVTRDVTEGSAIVLGPTLEQRRMIVKKVEHLYDMRSKVSHGGKRVADEDAVLEIKYLAINLLAKLSAMSGQFTTREAFRSWMVDQRLSP
jgi:hypothetical protein